MLIDPKFIIFNIKKYDCLQCLLFAIIRKVSCFFIFLPFATVMSLVFKVFCRRPFLVQLLSIW